MTLTPFPKSHSVSSLCAGKSKSDTESFVKWCEGGKMTIKLNQQHTDTVLIWKEHSEVGKHSQPADAILTDIPETTLTVRTADCLPILLLHETGLEQSTISESSPDHRSSKRTRTAGLIIGAIHAGRMGTEHQILQKTLHLLIAKWGTGYTSLWFGPHICEDCYQIDRSSNLFYNLRVKNQEQVESILPAKSFQIIDSEHCTYEGEIEWNSYRREGKGVPMNWSGIRINRGAGE